MLIIVREIDHGRIKALGRPATLDDLEGVSKFRVERQWSRGQKKEVLQGNLTRDQAEGYVCGVRDGIKLANA